MRTNPHNNSPEVDIDLHIEFRQREKQCKALEGNISEWLLGSIAARLGKRGAQIIDLEIELEYMLVQLGPLRQNVRMKKQNLCQRITDRNRPIIRFEKVLFACICVVVVFLLLFIHIVLGLGL